jgi:hypothetical protein
MTTMRNVPNLPWDTMPIGAWHSFHYKAVIIRMKWLL